MHHITTTITDGQITIPVADLNLADGTKVDITIKPAKEIPPERLAQLKADIQAGIDSMNNEGALDGKKVFAEIYARNKNRT